MLSWTEMPFYQELVSEGSEFEVRLEILEVVVVVSSRHPHHPGVSQVVVDVFEVVDVAELEVEVSLPSKYFQLKQSWHSGSE